jgi:heme/copper-type cytochrome/quinol oxidase subunit 1
VAAHKGSQAHRDHVLDHGVDVFFAGGMYASAIRLELLTPASDLLESGTYNKVFTQHGVLMIFFFLIPSIPAFSATSSSR